MVADKHIYLHFAFRELNIELRFAEKPCLIFSAQLSNLSTSFSQRLDIENKIIFSRDAVAEEAVARINASQANSHAARKCVGV